MRVAVLFAAVAALWVQPAKAAEIVQHDSLAAGPFGFQRFDSSLGVLLSVRLDITPDFARAFQAIYPGVLQNASVTWDASQERYCYDGACTPLIANGQADLNLIYSEILPGSYDYFVVEFSGETLSLDLDPQRFVSSNPHHRIDLARSDPGFYDESLTGIFQTTDGGRIRNATNVLCTSTVQGCDQTLFRLTYSFAPGGVPEPTTWAMMLLGFGAVGGAMRRRNRKAPIFA